MELFEKIRREYFEGVGTILGVAQKLGIHRRMVREAIRTAVPAKRKKMQRESSRLIAEGCSEKAFWWMSVRRHRPRKPFRKIDPSIPCANI